MMDTNRWNRTKAIFSAALDLPVGQQQTFLAAACGQDGDLRERVRGLPYP